MKKTALFILFLFCFSSCEQQFQPGYIYQFVLTSTSIATEKIDKEGNSIELDEIMTISVADTVPVGMGGVEYIYAFRKGDDVYNTKLKSFDGNKSGHIVIFLRDDGKYIRVSYISDKAEMIGGVNGAVYFYVTEPVATEKELKNAVKYKYHTL